MTLVVAVNECREKLLVTYGVKEPVVVCCQASIK